MSEPTLEQLAELADLVQCDTAYSLLARELIALQGTVGACWESGESCEAEFRKRLDHLESRARDYQPEIAVGAQDECESTPEPSPLFLGLIEEQARTRRWSNRCTTAIRERDAAIAERDEAYEKLTQNVREHYPPAFRIIATDRDARKAERDSARAEAERQKRLVGEAERELSNVRIDAERRLDDARLEQNRLALVASDLRGCITTVNRALDATEAERDSARDALRKYGAHALWCDHSPCNCGWNIVGATDALGGAS